MAQPQTRYKYDKRTLKLLLTEVKRLLAEGYSVEDAAVYLNTKTNFKPANSPEFNRSNLQQTMTRYKIGVKKFVRNNLVTANTVTRPIQTTKFTQDTDALRSLVLTATLSAQTKVDILMALEKSK